jgi:hypothetical protein
LRDPLIGRWLIAVKEHDDGCRTAFWRGQIVGKPGGGVFLCSLEYGSQTLVSLGEMRGWRFYTSEEMMGRAFESVWLPRTDAHRNHERDGARGE